MNQIQRIKCLFPLSSRKKVYAKYAVSFFVISFTLIVVFFLLVLIFAGININVFCLLLVYNRSTEPVSNVIA